MQPVTLAVDFDKGRLLVSNTQASEQARGQNVVWKNYTDLEVYPVKPYPEGGRVNPLQAIDVTARTLQIFIGPQGGPLYASLIDFTRDEENDKFTGTLSMNSANLTAAFTAGVTKLDTFIEFRLLGNGKPRSVIKPITIDRPIWEGDDPPDAEDQTPEWVVENLALILQSSDTIAVVQDGNTFHFDVIKKASGRLGSDAGGLYWEADKPAPDDLVPQLRLESPFEESSLQYAVNDTGTVSVVAGGVAGDWYLTKLRIRGASELRSYSGGQAIGYLYIPGDAPAAPRNVWKLTVSSPPQEFYLNYDASDDGVAVFDYVTPPLVIAAGATVTLSYDTTDGEQLQGDSQSVPGVTGPEDTYAPFMQIDQVPVEFELNPNTDYQLAEITEAGTTEVNVAKDRDIHTLNGVISVDGYTTEFIHKIVLKTVCADKGDIIECRLTIPASDLVTVQVLNGSEAGGVLHTIISEPFAQSILIRYVFNGTAWQEQSRQNTDGLQGNIYSRGPKNYAAAQIIDLDGPAVQQITLTGDVTLSTLSTSRASSGRSKNVSLLLTASGADCALALATGAKKVGPALTSLTDGNSCWINVTSVGADETDSYFAFAIVT